MKTQTELPKIYEGFYEFDTNDNIGIIRYCESNLLYIDNKESFKDYDDFFCFSQMIVQFVISLEKIGKYSKAIKYADKAISLFEANLNEYEIELNDFNYYWSVLTSKGRLHYEFKEYDKSILAFEKLLSWDSDNDNFKLWLDSAISKKRRSINKYLYAGAIFLLILSYVIKGQTENIYRFRLIPITGFFLVVVAAINEFVIDEIVKWRKKS